jgi:transposase-like protein
MGRPARYPEEFRREAVELYRQLETVSAEVAKSLGISDRSLAAWVKAVEGDACLPRNGNRDRARAEIEVKCAV